MIEPRNEFNGKVDGFETLEDYILLSDKATTEEYEGEQKFKQANRGNTRLLGHSRLFQESG